MAKVQASNMEVSNSRSAEPSAVVQQVGIALYRLLTGSNPAEAEISADDDFDRHALASILVAAALDGGSIVERVGIPEHALRTLLAGFFPAAAARAFTWIPNSSSDVHDETAVLRELLLAQRSTAGDVGHWLAAMVARRAMEPHHLWQDLGLRGRTELSRLLTRHFAPLARRNTGNMRWKRFFYRVLCERDGFGMCTAPVCTQCADFGRCFGEESGESRLVERKL